MKTAKYRKNSKTPIRANARRAGFEAALHALVQAEEAGKRAQRLVDVASLKWSKARRVIGEKYPKEWHAYLEENGWGDYDFSDVLA
jgi:hypothetical protein